MKKFIIGICLISVLYLNCMAYDGQLDSSFNGNGTVITAINNYAQIFATAIQDDRKIVVAGRSGPDSSTADFTLARYNTDGILDTTFGTLGTGIVVTSLGGTSNTIFSMVLQTDGKIVVAGQGTASNTFVVARYNTNGTLDTTFGTAGIGIVATLLGGSAAAFGVALQSDGKIVAAGQLNPNSNSNFIVIRYNTDGTLDSSFGASGIFSFLVATNALVSMLTVQADGKIDVVGSAIPLGGVRELVVARVNTNGTLDATFGGTGIVFTPVLSGDTFGENIIVQPDGKIVVCGSTTTGIGKDGVLVRYNIDGSLDSTFNADGIVTTALGDNNQIFRLAVQADGKLIAGGSSDISGTETFAVTRYNTDGVIDVTFNPSATPAGTVFTSFGVGEVSRISQVSLQQNGRIVASGFALPGGTNSVFAVARYLNNNPLVATQITSPINNVLFSSTIFTVSGTAQNPSNIGIFADGVLIGRTVTSGSTNTWSAITTVPLGNGPHVITAVAEYKDGNVNLASTNSITICVDACRSALSSAIAAKYCSETLI